MRPSDEVLHSWIAEYDASPKASFETGVVPTAGTEFSLLDHLQYTPAERNQGSCGDCWAWAGTAVLEVALDVKGINKDRLSVQYLNSNYHGGTGWTWACCGGWLSDVSSFYQSKHQAIPWSNTNAGWADGSGGCPGTTSVPGSSISTSPKYGITTITYQSIATQHVGQARAIANIKNVLHQYKAVWFGYFLATGNDWSDFFNFWDFQTESAAWSPDPYSGQMWSGGAGHAVVVVGYNDIDPSNAYWIVLNSWGTAGGNRPNGLFHMKMKINYDNYFYDPYPHGYYSLYFQTLEVKWNALQVTPISPGSGASVFSPVELKVRVTSPTSAAVSGATVKFYLDDVEVLSTPSLLTGYASYVYSPSSLTSHTWYATAEKSGYNSGASTPRSFTVYAIYAATITGVVVVPGAAHVGQGSKVTFTVSVTNTGPSDIASAMVKVTIHKPGGALAATVPKPISAFMHGSSRSVDVVYTLAASAPTGTWTYDVYLYRLTALLDDYTGQTFTVEVPLKTGSIQSVVDAPDPVLRGQTATFTVTFKNTGNIVWSSAKITVKVYKPGGTVLATQRMLTVMNVVPGVDYARDLTWLVPATYPTGQYTYNVYLSYLTTQVDKRELPDTMQVT
jgi:hypothetical protein